MFCGTCGIHGTRGTHTFVVKKFASRIRTFVVESLAMPVFSLYVLRQAFPNEMMMS